MPFRRQPLRDAADRAYGAIVGQARLPEFFTALGVPDTLDGRFELICLHAFLFLRRLKTEGAAAASLGQQIVDTMFADFDRSLREIGTGDLSVGRQVKRMAEAIGNQVVELTRTRIGPLELTDLRRGEARRLDRREIDALWKDSGG